MVLYILMLVNLFICLFFFFKQKTAYEMRISDWSSDVCSSDLRTNRDRLPRTVERRGRWPCPSALLLRRKAGRSDAAAHPTHGAGGEIGRASCRERGCQYV